MTIVVPDDTLFVGIWNNIDFPHTGSHHGQYKALVLNDPPQRQLLQPTELRAGAKHFFQSLLGIDRPASSAAGLPRRLSPRTMVACA
jgi:hypothetical protein